MNPLSVSGFTVLGGLHASNNSIVCRALRERDGAALVLKILQEEYPSPKRVAQLKCEYEVTRALEFSGVIAPYSVERVGPRWLMTLEDFGGESLSRLELAGKLSLSRFYNLALQLSEILKQLHLAGVIHKDVNPSNLLLNGDTGEVKIIDFGISTVLTREQQDFRNPAVLQGTLAYISPEQTGRINRSIDYRTDFYSLGITFYELLTGRLPFPSDDPLTVVHGHIAREAIAPHALDSGVPSSLSDIVMKLMAKNADERYQSATGLTADLKRSHELMTSGPPDASSEARFTLGEHDESDRFQVSQLLYGRDTEIATLMDAFARAAAGGRELMLVAGYSGIGKSALVKEVYRPITEQRGYFISGKYDQFQRNIPYSAFIQAFRALALHVLSESEQDIAQWRAALLEALKANGAVIINVLPEVEHLIGPQPSVQNLEGREARNRFNVVFQDFIAVFATEAHPLAIFLDDLQWADGGSMSLLKLLLESPKSSHLMVIGAYRDNEVDETHTLALTLEELKANEAPVTTIHLGPLELPEVTALIADTLRQPADAVASLADLVIAKTRGNPFFLNVFLGALHSDELISYDHEHHRWRWDLGEIEAKDMTDNVVDLMLATTRKLPEVTQSRMVLAACIGGSFDLATLALVSGERARQVATDLWPAIEQGLILPLSDTYKLVELEVEGLEDEVNVEYKFVHDRVQQAAYSLVPVEERPAIHWRTGQTLLRHTPEASRRERIFDIVNQLNQGPMETLDNEARLELHELNRMASRKARAAIAFEPAYGYLETAIGLLTGGALLDDNAIQRAFEVDPKRVVSLYVDATELAYLKTDYAGVEKLAAVVEALTEDPLILARVFDAKIASSFAEIRYIDSIKAGLSILARLGFKFPLEPTDADIGAAMEQTSAALKGRVIEELVDLPPMTDSRVIAAMSIISAMVPAVFVSMPPLFPIITLKQVELSVKHGNNNQSPVAYSCYALILCGIVGNIDDGYRFGLLSEALLTKLDAKERYAMTTAISNCGARHWKEPILSTVKDMTRAYRAGVDSGDLEYAAISLEVYCYHCYYGGRALPLLEPEIGGFVEAIHNIGLTRTKRGIMSYQQACQNLMGKAPDPTILAGDVGDSAAWERIALEANDHHALGTIYLHRTMLNNLFRRYDEAARYSELSIAKLFASPGFCYHPVAYFHDSLVQLAIYADADEEQQTAIAARVEANQQRMKTWADHAPFNQLHRWQLVEAERARVEGRNAEAREHYDAAIRLCQTHGFLHEEGLSQELAGRFYIAQKRRRIADIYLADARFAYEQWGAMAKVKDIVETYGLSEPSRAPANPDSMTTSRRGTEVGAGNQTLDLKAVLKATQAISSEVVLDTLLARVMTIVMQSAGAERALLMLEDQGELRVQAACSAKAEAVDILPGLPISQIDDDSELALPQSLVNYTARIKNSVVLNDVSNEGDFTRDPYVLKRQPRSVMCTALVKQGQLIGLLYLENNLTTGAFTADRVELLRMLSAQAAISLENAKLYANLEALTAAQRRFVPYQFLENLNQGDITQVQLGQHVAKEMSVLFADIRGFTTMTERLDPTEVVTLLNNYFSEMEPAIVNNGGFIDSFTGDEIMALFDSSPESAVRAGIGMQRALYVMNERSSHQPPLTTGLGVATGSLLLSIVGGRDRIKCGVVGDVVNLTSRIEQLTKRYGAPMLIGESTYRRLPDPSVFSIRMVDRVAVKGKNKAGTVYEVIDAETDERRKAKEATKASVTEALKRYYERDFTGALGLFAAAKGKMQDDMVPTAFFRRCLRFIENPPPEDWEGVEVLTEK